MNAAKPETADPEPTIQSLFDLTGKVAIVTGGTGHLGSAMSRALAEAGATVIITSRDESRARAVAVELPGPAAHYGVGLDQMDGASIERAWNNALQVTGRVDVLVNNGHEALAADWTTVTAEQFSRQLTNATAYFLLARLCRDHAVARRSPASIIMIGSMYGLVGSYPDAYAGITNASPVAYHALKGGIIHMTRHLAVYWAGDGVRVNCLSPGPFPSAKADPRMVERLCTKSPMKRMGVPYELKGAIVFLAGDASSYVTGHNLVVDGGWTAW
ncbi:MAG: SDR family oxidoreductase [Planctomycetes bacterium]|nr:SDR family oxidoreductase [Planctomycetota bacterium]